MAMTCVSGDDLEMLQEALEFVTHYDVSPNGVVSSHGDVRNSPMLMQEEPTWSGLQQLLNGTSHGSAIDSGAVFDTTQGYSSPPGSSIGDSSDTKSLTDSPPSNIAVVNNAWPTEEESFYPSPPTSRRRPGKSRKDEIKELKKLVVKLTKRLDAMNISSRSLTTNQQQRSISSLLWKDIVTRQFNLRQLSEAENARLRKEVAVQFHNSTNLKRMLKRRYSEEMLELVPMLKREQKMLRSPIAENNRIFCELLGGTDRVYAETDALFEMKGMANVPCPGRTNLVHRDTVNGVYLEFLDKSYVPFDYNKTTRAVWKALGGRRLNDGDHVQTKVCAHETQQADDTMTSYFSYNCAPNGIAAYVQERRAARKYVEGERAVIISGATTEPMNRTFGSLGLLFQETWAIVVRKGEMLASGQETSVVESCLWLTRCDEGKQEGLKFRDAAFADIALDGYGTKLSLHNQRVENILFDEALLG